MDLVRKEYQSGSTSGVAVPAGKIGERFVFTGVTITAVTGGVWTASTAIGTLQPGVWMFSWQGGATGAASATLAEIIISTNNTADPSGALTIDGTNTAYCSPNTNGVTAGAFYFAGPQIYYNIAVATTLYVKAVSYGASRSCHFKGSAVRIA